MLTDPDQSAYPEPLAYHYNEDEMWVTSETTASCGFTKREALAAMAMQGILSSLPASANYHPITTARLAVEHADALIRHLNLPPLPKEPPL